MSKVTNAILDYYTSYGDRSYPSYAARAVATCDQLVGQIFWEVVRDFDYSRCNSGYVSSEEFVEDLFPSQPTHATRMTIRGEGEYADDKGKSFAKVARKTLIEMAGHPLERRFLWHLKTLVHQGQTFLTIEQGRSHPEVTDFPGFDFIKGEFAKYLPPAGSNAQSEGYRLLTQDVRFETVRLLLEGEEGLFLNTRREWHLQPLPPWRLLGHELIHTYHNLTGSRTLVSKFPPSGRWSNCEEQVTMTGHCMIPLAEGESVPACGLKFEQEFSENAFAIRRWMPGVDVQYFPRISHTGLTNAPGHGADYRRFLSALSMGAGGTVEELMIVSSTRDEVAKIFQEKVAKIDMGPKQALKLKGGVTVDVDFSKIAQGAIQEVYAEKIAARFDVRLLPVEDLLKVYHTLPWKAVNAQDEEFLKVVKQRKLRCFETLLQSLIFSGLQPIARQILAVELPRIYFEPIQLRSHGKKAEAEELEKHRNMLEILTEQVPGGDEILKPIYEKMESMRKVAMRVLPDLQKIGRELEAFRKKNNLL